MSYPSEESLSTSTNDSDTLSDEQDEVRVPMTVADARDDGVAALYWIRIHSAAKEVDAMCRDSMTALAIVTLVIMVTGCVTIYVLLPKFGVISIVCALLLLGAVYCIAAYMRRCKLFPAILDMHNQQPIIYAKSLIEAHNGRQLSRGELVDFLTSSKEPEEGRDSSVDIEPLLSTLAWKRLSKDELVETLACFDPPQTTALGSYLRDVLDALPDKAEPSVHDT